MVIYKCDHDRNLFIQLIFSQKKTNGFFPCLFLQGLMVLFVWEVLLETKDSQEKKNNLINIIICNLIWGWEDILRSMIVIQQRESEINKLALMSALIRILFSAAEAEWSGTAQLCLCCATARGADKTRETSQCLALKFGSKILEAVPDVLIGNLNKFLFSFNCQGDAKLSSRLQT